MGTIKLNQVRLYAYHGCLSEETAVGSDYLVDLSVDADLTLSAGSDNLKDTVDYVLLNAIISDEMAKPRKLLEAVAGSIVERVLSSCPLVNSVSVSVSKINPPIGGDVASVAVEIVRERK